VNSTGASAKLSLTSSCVSLLSPAEANATWREEYNRLHEVFSAIQITAFTGKQQQQQRQQQQQQQQQQPFTITIENRTNYDKKFSDHKDQGNHPLQIMNLSVQQQQQS
jgi:hypothetical protein